MIYLDTSVVLSRLFAEPKSPTDAFWLQEFASSRLLEYEVLNRLHARAADTLLLQDARALLDSIELFDLAPDVLVRALQPFPVPVRTLDGLHLATMDFLRANGQAIEVATYDARLAQAAVALGFAIAAM